MNTDEIALRVWYANNTCMPADGMNKLKEFAHALLADIEQRTAEAIAHWIRCGDHHGVITSDDVLAGKWKEYL